MKSINDIIFSYREEIPRLKEHNRQLFQEAKDIQKTMNPQEYISLCKKRKECISLSEFKLLSEKINNYDSKILSLNFISLYIKDNIDEIKEYAKAYKYLIEEKIIQEELEGIKT